jgi:hypothetical protein
LGCRQKPTLVRGLMTVTFSGAIYLVEGAICAPLSSLSIVVTACRRPAKGATLILWSWACVPIFFGRIVPAVDPDSRVS